MKEFPKLLKLIIPYRIKVVLGIVFESLSVVFALFSYTMVIPFLRILFNPEKLVTTPTKLTLSVDSLQNNLFYFLSQLITSRGIIYTLLLVSFIIVIASLLKNGFLYLSRHMFTPVMNGIVKDYQRAIYNKLIFLPLAFFSDERKGNILTRMTSDVLVIKQNIGQVIGFIFTKPITIVIFLGYLFYLNYALTIVVLLSLPIMGFVITRLARNLKTKSYNSQQLQAEQMNLLEESISGLRVVKSFNAENKLINKFEEVTEKIFRINNKVERRVRMASPMSEFLGTIVVMCIMYFGSYMILGKHSSMTSEAFIAYLVIFSQIINPAKEMVDAFYNIQKGLASIKRIDEVLDVVDTIVEDSEPVAIKQFENKIEFKDVCFAYDDDKIQILHDLNLEIKKGQTIAIVGESGAGKSTVADLLPRFYDYTKGVILIDGVPLKKLVIDDLRDLYGIVSQEAILFNDTIRNNITFGADKYSEEDIIKAAKVANAYDFIMEKPQGFDTEIGEEGGKLSGGQRQRLSIARAVLKNPPILILDEATSSLDTESEKLVQNALDSIMKDKTSIVIAHRLSTVKNADKIFVMSEGRIVEQGKHDELIQKGGIYKKLVDLQMV